MLAFDEDGNEVSIGGSRDTNIPSDRTVHEGHDPEIRALLDTIASRESTGYDAMYSGSGRPRRFDDFSDHPRSGDRIVFGPNAGKTSAAAGRYQHTPATWDRQAQKLGLNDFSPENQDISAADLAESTYGSGMLDALKTNDDRKIAGVGRKLSGQWTSLPGGIEATMTDSDFIDTYRRNLAKYKQGASTNGKIGFTDDELIPIEDSQPKTTAIAEPATAIKATEPSFIDRSLALAKGISLPEVKALEPPKPEAPSVDSDYKALEDSLQTTLAPQYVDAVRNAYEAATPEKRQELMAAPGELGAVASYIHKKYQDSQGVMSSDPALQATGGRREDVVLRNKLNGMDQQSAETMADREVRFDAAPITGQAQSTDFDFERSKRLRKAGPVRRGLEQGYEDLQRQAAGLHQMAADFADSMGIPGAKGYSQAQSKARDKLSMREQEMGEAPNEFDRHLESAIRSTVTNAPGLVAGVFTGAEAIPLLGMGAQVAGDEYANGIKEGLSRENSTKRAVLFGAAEILGEKVGNKDQLELLKRAAGGNLAEFEKLFVKNLAEQIVGEEATTVAQWRIDKSKDLGLNPEATGKELLNQMKDTVFQTVLQTSIMASPGAARAVSNRLKESDRRYQTSNDTLESVLRTKIETLTKDPEFVSIMRNETDSNLSGIDRGKQARQILAERRALSDVRSTDVSQTGISGESNAQNTHVSGQGNAVPTAGQETESQKPGNAGAKQDLASESTKAQSEVGPYQMRPFDGGINIIDGNGNIVSAHERYSDAVEAFDQLNAASPKEISNELQTSPASVNESTGRQTLTGRGQQVTQGTEQGSGQEAQQEGHHGLKATKANSPDLLAQGQENLGVTNTSAALTERQQSELRGHNLVLKKLGKPEMTPEQYLEQESSRLKPAASNRSASNLDVVNAYNEAVDYHNETLDGGGASPSGSLHRSRIKVATTLPSSGLLQRRTAESIAKIFGHQVIFVESEDGRTLDIDGSIVGSHPNHILLAVDSKQQLSRVAVHEMVHGLRRNAPEIYAQLVRNLREHYNPIEVARQLSNRGYEPDLPSPNDNPERFTPENRNEEEWVSDHVSDIIHNPKAIKQLAERMEGQKKGSGQTFLLHVRDFIDSLISKLKGKGFGTEAAVASKHLRKSRDAVVEALAAYHQRQSEKGSSEESLNGADLAESKRRKPELTGGEEFTKRENVADYQLQVERNQRVVKSSASLSEEEKQAIKKGAADLGLDERQAMELARETKKRFPKSAGWDAPTVIGLDVKEDKKGDQVPVIEWATIPYKFHQEPGQSSATKGLNKPFAKKIANKIVKEIESVIQRAKQGDKNAAIIMGHANWYRKMAERLRAEFGGFADVFADLLGATSPNTAVEQNWNNAIDVMRRFVRGDFDSQLNEFDQWLKDGKSVKDFKDQKPEQLITRITGAKYGMNSDKAMKALLGLWRAVKKGDAPKARNFALNLVGLSDKATIDVWAARFLQRLAGYPRIPTVSEDAVQGSHLTNPANVGGAFGFGQEAFAQAAETLRSHGLDIRAPDLQAIVWFLEKEYWTKNNWTSKAGEGGSFEEQLDKAPASAWQAGYTIAKSGPAPDDSEMAAEIKRITPVLKDDPDVIAYRILPTQGLYAGWPERSFDQEVIATKEWDPSKWISTLVEGAQREEQYDMFVSRKLGLNEGHPNARPGLEVTFSRELTSEEVQPIMEMIVANGVDGFTLSVNPINARTFGDGGQDSKKYAGLRLQYVPEIFLRAVKEGWASLEESQVAEEYGRLTSGDVTLIKQALDDKYNRMADAVDALQGNPNVTHAKVYLYNTLVIGKENYSGYSAGLHKTANHPFGEEKSEQSIIERLEGSISRLRVGSRSVGGSNVLQRESGSSDIPASNRSYVISDERNGAGSEASARPSYGTTKRGAIRAVGVHYSGTKRERLSGSFYGQGAKGEEAERVNNAADTRLQNRVYFYINAGKGVSPEQGVGGHAHSVLLKNLYDLDADPMSLGVGVTGDTYNDRLNNLESAIIDAGYDGYVTDFGTQRAAVLIGNHSISVRYEGIGRPEIEVAERGQENDVKRIARLLSQDWSRKTPKAWGEYLKAKQPALFDRYASAFTSTSESFWPDEMAKRLRAVDRSQGKADVVDLPSEIPASIRRNTRVGININDDSQDFTKQILSGEKTIETRTRPTLRPYIGKRVGIVKTGKGKPAELVGFARIISEKRYGSAEEFDADYAAHKVSPDSPFHNGGIKFGYTLENVKKIDPIRLSSKGIVARSLPEDLDIPVSNRRQTETPAFKRWFGDSKVVDESGKPLVVYHGSSVRPLKNGRIKGDIKVFDRLFSINWRSHSIDTVGSWFSTNPSDDGAQMYSGKSEDSVIYPVYLSIQKPHTTTFQLMLRRARLLANGKDDGRMVGEEEVNAYRKWLKATDKDGIHIVHDEGAPNGSTEFKGQDAWIVLEPNQIKSATGNNGEFSPTNPDIRFSNRSQPTFYSQLARGIESSKIDSMPASQWRAWLLSNKGKLGIKDEEIAWTGLDDYLNLQGKEKLTKTDLSRFLTSNGVRVKDVIKGGVDEMSDEAVARAYESIYGTTLDDDGDPMPVDEMRDMIRDEIEYTDNKETARYEEYTLPGGKNYRELLITLPGKVEVRNKRFREIADEMNTYPERYNELLEERTRLYNEHMNNDYRSVHWEEKNVIAHIRFNDRTDLDGKKVLFIEEIQSDWAQEGRKRGFADEKTKVPAFQVSIEGRPVTAYETRAEAEAHVARAEKYNDPALITIEEVVVELNDVQGQPKVPAAPFVKDTKAWVSLALKRIIRHAAEGDYDKVAFVNGEQSADRYDLSKKISKVKYEDNNSRGIADARLEGDPSSGTLTAYDLSGREIITKTLNDPSEMEDVIGKELANKLLESEPKLARVAGFGVRRRELSGVDIKVGGEGMRAFYDGIVPQVANEVLKKIGGGRIGKVEFGPRGANNKLGAEFIPANARVVVRSTDPGVYQVWATNSRGVDQMHGENFSTYPEAMQYLEDLTNSMRQPGFDVTESMREKALKGMPLFSNRNNVMGQPTTATWESPVKSTLDNLIYTMQDKLVDTKRVQKAIEAAQRTIEDEWNPYQKEMLFHGRSAKLTQDFLVNEIKPLFKAMADEDVTMEQLEMYLWGRHAEERNNQIASINPSMPDAGSGLSNQEAADYLNKLTREEKDKLDRLSKLVDKITEGTRKLLVSSGLETQDTILDWQNTYQFYVPLQRADVEGSRSRPGTGQGFSIKGPSTKRAMGSERPVVDILANVMMQRERTIVRSEKNKVALALYGLAIQNENPGFWLPVNPDAVKAPVKTMHELMNLGLDALDFDGLMKEPTVRVISPKTGLVETVVNPMLRNRDNVLAVRVNGKDRFIFFNQDDPRAVRMVESLKNLDADQLGTILTVFREVTRWFASVNTQFNPVFGIVNLTRDVSSGAINLTSTKIAGKEAAVLKHVAPAIAGIYKDLRADRKGKARSGGNWSKLWEEFQEVGGKTGYRDLYMTSEDRAKALQKEIDAIYEGAPKKFFKGVFNWLSDYNETLENGVRLAAYKVARDQGISKDQAAALAKNLTVNFNKKGQIAQQAGALYAFFNASVQGNARMAETLAGPAGKKIVAGGLILGAVQAMLLSAVGFDDDEPPEFVRERNIIIPLGKKNFFTYPMPLGLHVIPNTGRILTEIALNGGDGATRKLIGLLGSYIDAFDPMGSSGLSVQTLTPTLIDPLAAITENRDSFGKEIAKKDRSSLAPTPGFTRARDTASTFGKAISKAINLLSDGTDYVPGDWSPTPDQVDFLIGQVTGGVGREALKVDQTVRSLVSGEELPPHKIPLVGRFYGTTTSQSAESGKFYSNLTMLNKHEAQMKGMAEEGKDVDAYVQKNPEAVLAQAANSVEQTLTKLKTTKRLMLSRGADRSDIKSIEGEITSLMRDFNQRVKESREAPNDRRP